MREAKWLRTLVVVCFVFSLLSTSIVLAHSGGTDANGGHWNRSTGEYHYHHGYPAHQHINGVCQYEFDDKTGQTSGNSSGKNSGKTNRIFASSITILSSPDVLFVGNSEKIKWELTPETASDKYVTWTSLDTSIATVDKYGNVSGIAPGSVKIRGDAEGGASVSTLITVKAMPVETQKEEAPQTKVKWYEKAKWYEIALIALAVIVLVVLPIASLVAGTIGAVVDSVKSKKEKVSKKKAEQEEYSKRRDELLQEYAGKTLDELAPLPNGMFIGQDGLPASQGDGLWGSVFTVYKTDSGTKFHYTKGCSGAFQQSHILHFRNGDGCQKCSRSRWPDLSWYYKRQEILRNCEKYKIKLQPSKSGE